MRTTIDLPDALYEQAKAASDLRGIRLEALVATAIQRLLEEERSRQTYEVDLPLIRTGKPGTLDLANAEIDDLLT